MNASKVIGLGLSDRFLREHLPRPLIVVADRVSMEAAIHLALSCVGEVIELNRSDALARKFPQALGVDVPEQVFDALRSAGLSYLHVPKGNGSLANRGWPTLQAVAFFESGGSMKEAKRLFKGSRLAQLVEASPTLSAVLKERQSSYGRHAYA